MIPTYYNPSFTNPTSPLDMLSFDSSQLIPLWTRFSRYPAGNWLFNRVLHTAIPYSGTIGARVIELRPGHCVTSMADRRRVRNHLNSIHAIAQANQLELTSGLALISGIRADARGILVGFEVEYLKKARGTLHGYCTCELPATGDSTTCVVEVNLKDTEDDVVAAAKAHWLIGPKSRS